MNDNEIVLREMLDLRRRLERIETTEIAPIISLNEIHARSVAGLCIEDDNGNLRLCVQDGGRVGIGTSNPAAKLDIVGTSDVTCQIRADGGQARFIQSSYRNDTDGGYFRFYAARGSLGTPVVSQSGDRVAALQGYGYSGAGTAFRSAASIEFYVDAEPDTGGDTSDMPGRITFNTSNDGGSTLQERMRIDSAGNVGIATTSPDTKLQVVGDTKFGADTTNYATFAADGELNLYGTARVKKEIVIPINRTTLGASAPTATTRAVGATGAIRVPVLQFSKVTQQDIHFEVHMPADVDDSANVQFHLMWFPGASWTTGNYVWKLEYLVVPDSGGTITAGTPTTIASTVTPVAATVAIETEFADTIDANGEYVIWCHLYRDVASDNGDDVGELRFCEVEYTANKLGEAT